MEVCPRPLSPSHPPRPGCRPKALTRAFGSLPIPPPPACVPFKASRAGHSNHRVCMRRAHVSVSRAVSRAHELRCVTRSRMCPFHVTLVSPSRDGVHRRVCTCARLCKFASCHVVGCGVESLQRVRALYSWSWMSRPSAGGGGMVEQRAVPLGVQNPSGAYHAPSFPMTLRNPRDLGSGSIVARGWLTRISLMPLGWVWGRGLLGVGVRGARPGGLATSARPTLGVDGVSGGPNSRGTVAKRGAA